MLPVLGLLRTYPCPHAIAGLCARPNCFYSHKKHEIEQAKKKINADILLSSQRRHSTSERDGVNLVPENQPVFQDTGLSRQNISKSKRETNASSEPNGGGLQSQTSMRSDKIATEEVNKKKLDNTAVGESHVGDKSEKHKRSSIKQGKSENEEVKKRRHETTETGSKHHAEGRSENHRTDILREEKTEQEKVKKRKLESTAANEYHDSDRSEKYKRTSIKEGKAENEVKKRKHETTTGHKHHGEDRHEKHRRSSLKEEKFENDEATKRKRHSHKLSSDESQTDVPGKKEGKLQPPHTDTNGVISNENIKSAALTPMKTMNSENENGVGKIKIKPMHELLEEAIEPSAFMLPECESADDDDPDQIELECLQMFNSYKPNHKEQNNLMTPKNETSLTKDEIVRNKRVAHSGATDLPKPIPPPSKPRISATEAMLRRYEQVKQQGLVVNTDVSSRSVPSEGKKRIAHVANVSGLMKPTTGTSLPDTKVHTVATTTIAHTVNKGEARQAHHSKVPESTFPAPRIPWESAKTSKIPVVVRQKILDQLFQECKKIYDQPQDAATRALAEEKELGTRCSSKAVYFCSGTNVVSRLRKEANAGPAAGSSKGGAVSHLSVIAGASGARNSWSIESVKKMAWPPPGPLLYIGLTRYLLTEEQLVTNSFPRRSPLGGGRAVITPQQQNTPKSKVDLTAQPFLRICDRCTKSYKVDKEGLPVVREKCVYHHGRKFKRKVNGIIEGRYTCCDGDVSAEGCSLSDYHVSSQCSNELRGFVRAIKDPGDEESMGLDPWDIIALDCEMIYTTHGNELARVTIIGFNKEILYDEFVKPIHPVLDYNTKFSGITEQMLDCTTTTLTDVQAVLLTRLRPNTIIVGHSLENDLLALKLIHNTVVDTSVLFPHRLGPPLKRALRNLSTECLGKIIQMGEGGHDSAEDARSALELALWKLKEDSKLQDCFQRP